MDSEVLRARREQRRRLLRRRRLAVSALVAVAALVAAIVTATGGSDRGSSSSQRPVRSPGGATGASRHAGTPGSASAAAPASGHPGTASVPILMYHVIAPPPPGAPFPGLYVPPSEFAAQMQALKDAGWHAVTLDRLASYWKRGTPLGAGKPIILTFDNGYQSQYTQALPVLQRLGWVANENLQLTGLPPSQGGLGEAQIRGLVAAGWELDTQGFSHADLITLNAEQLHYQIAVARGALQRRFHVPVNWFCYPSGHYDATVIAAVKAAGYAGSTTVVPGWARRSDDPYRLHRLRVLGGTTPQGLLEQLASTRQAPQSPPSYTGA
jgi:peptidoglycan/xylan/chitin deacetylase (PgdA/CDA1 family)